MKRRLGQGVVFIWAVLLSACAYASFLGGPPEPVFLRGEWVQGATLVGQTEPGTQVWFNGRSVPVSAEGLFIFGLARDEPAEAELRLRDHEGRERSLTYEVRSRRYAVQEIKGLPSAMVTPPAAVLDQIRLDIERVQAARALNTPRTDFAARFIWPVLGPITGVYGSQRILNGEPRQPHYGIDIAAAEGTPVAATAGGVVRLARTDLYYTGGTIILDHGHGLSSTYLHLSKVEVREGQEVQLGQTIGRVGATGRATGPHLCFRLNWFDVRLDPELLLGPMPGTANP